ncbi:Tad domain-containing protein [Granulosicoccaceae sp. 1_MG-2023]|nr:Tad domain-containing protein [Granulosicoccaceae sp. 1_MG-2023]
MIMLIVSLVALLGVAGLAIDVGNAFLVQTRLQNAMDAAALSAAKTLNRTHSTALAELHGNQTFQAHLDYDLSAYKDRVTAVFAYSEKADPFVVGASDADARFVRVTLSDVPVSVVFANALNGVGDSFDLDAGAVAGPIPVGGDGGEVCGVSPIAMCSGSTDTDCSDGWCFGLNIDSDTELCLDTGEESGGLLTEGLPVLGGLLGPITDLLEVGGDSACADLALDVGINLNALTYTPLDLDDECVAPGTEVPTVESEGLLATLFGTLESGLNLGFDGLGTTVDAALSPVDVITDFTDYDQDNDFWYGDYLGQYVSGVVDEVDGRLLQRVLRVPVGSCDSSGVVEVSAVLCLFLTRPGGTLSELSSLLDLTAVLGSDDSPLVFAQVIAGCESDGDTTVVPGDEVTTDDYGTYRIVLYKNAAEPDA